MRDRQGTDRQGVNRRGMGRKSDMSGSKFSVQGKWLWILIGAICLGTVIFVAVQFKAMFSENLGGFSGENGPGGEHAGFQDGQNGGEITGTAGVTDPSLPLICVDPGHGFDDPGAMHSNLKGLSEKDINLDIALRLADILREKGYPVMMTRTSDEILPGMKKDNRGLYVMKPQERCDLANRSKAELFVSIHCNSIEGNSSARGMQLYYTENHTPDNDTYAERLADQLEKSFGSRPQIKANPEYDSFVVNRKVKAPSVLVETGFITNGEDAKLMLSPEWRQQMAEALAEGIEAFVKGETV